jgi:hypothetical protein
MVYRSTSEQRSAPKYVQSILLPHFQSYEYFSPAQTYLHNNHRSMKFVLLGLVCMFAFCKQPPKPGAQNPEPNPQNLKPAMPAAAFVPPAPTPGKMNGLTFVAPPEPFVSDPMPAVKSVGASWIAVIPYGYTKIGVPEVRFDVNNWQWWGERPEGVRETIRQAHEDGLKVMLKPQIYIPYGWTGSLDFATPEEWAKWEAAYERYILLYADIARTMQVELFCIGTEFRNAVAKRPEYWQELIGKIRAAYPGQLTYSSNWDDWDQMPFWDQLDYVGLSGYFPLVDDVVPEVGKLCAAWKPICEKLKNFSAQHGGKPILFTEFGYLSVDGCGGRNWELERFIEGRNINEQAQANCFEALFATFQHEPWWAGGFLWKWFPNMRGHEGYPERDYTPQGKKAEKMLAYWYGGQ